MNCCVMSIALLSAALVVSYLMVVKFRHGHTVSYCKVFVCIQRLSISAHQLTLI